MAVFYRQDAEKAWVPENWSGNTQAQLDKLQSELEKAKDTNERKFIREQILSLRRELNRAKQYTTISNNKLVEWKNNLDSISAANLMRLDKEASKEKRWEFLSKSFLYKRTEEKDGNVLEEPVEQKDIKEWDTLYVDFGKNKSANSRIGAGHMLPASINIVKIVTNINWKSFEQYWKRETSNNLTGYYNADGKYIAIYTWDQIIIPKVSEVSQVAWFHWINVFETSDENMRTRVWKESSALDNFINEIDWLEKIERWSWISALLIQEAWKNLRYQDSLNKAIEIWEWYIVTWHDKYTKEDIEIAIKRLKKTKELLWENNLWLDIESYKSAISMYESGAKWYHARNDETAKRNWISWIHPEKIAYWKYQFIPATLRGYTSILDGYNITLSSPPKEEEIQKWLNNPDAQEAVMDKYIIDMAKNTIFSNEAVWRDIMVDPTKIAFYLALTHIGWAGAINNQSKTDYFGTPVSRYANITWERYNTKLQ